MSRHRAQLVRAVRELALFAVFAVSGFGEGAAHFSLVARRVDDILLLLLMLLTRTSIGIAGRRFAADALRRHTHPALLL